MIQNITLNSQIFNVHNVKSSHVNKVNNKNVCISNINRDTISFTSQINHISFNDFIRKTIGTLSIEDLLKIDARSSKLLKKHNNEKKLTDLDRINIDKIYNLFDKFEIKYQMTKQGMQFEDNLEVLNKKTRNKIKKYYINFLCGRTSLVCLKQPELLLRNPSYDDWFKGIGYKTKIPNAFHSIYVHPCDKAKIFISEFTKQEKELIEKKAQQLIQKKLKPIILEIKKEKVLNNIRMISESSEIKKNGALNLSKLNKLRKNLMDYEIYDKALNNNKIFSKEIESVICNSGKKLSEATIGNFIDDLGLVVQKTTVYDKEKQQNISTLILFNKEKGDHSLKLIKIDEEHEKNVINLKIEYEKIKLLLADNKEKFKDKIVNLENKAKTIIASEKEMNIARVHFNIVPPDNLRGFLKDMNQPQKIEGLIEHIKSQNPNNNKIALIIDFVNNDAKRFFNAGRKVVLPLLEILKQNNCKDIFMSALAIGEGKHSPLPLYLRAGFKPLSHTMEEIEKATSNLQRWDPQIPVFMYLPEDAMVYQILEKEQPLKEINSFTRKVPG